MNNKRIYALTDEQAKWLGYYAKVGGYPSLDDTLTPLDRDAAVEHMAQAIWAHSTGALCGDPLCRYATVDADADYQCQCTDCQGQAESLARAALDALQEDK